MRPGVLLVAFVALAPLACGGARQRDASALRAELREGLEASRSRAAETVARAEAALVDAEDAEAAGDPVAAADHRAHARLLAALADAEAAEAEHVEARAQLDAETAGLAEEALAFDERARAREAEARRLAGASTAREEALRALARAEVDEARGRRVIRLSLDDAMGVRRAASAIRERARLLLAAAISIAARGSTSIDEARSETEALLARSEAAEEPIAALARADEAHDAARVALGLARRPLGVRPETVTSLLEACASEGFSAILLERGVSIDLAAAFAETGRTPSREGGPRIARLAALLSSYPAGPVEIEVSARGALAASRAESLRAALTAGGLPAERVELRASGAELSSVRVVLSGYARVPPETARRLEGPPPTAGDGASVEAHPTPALSDE